MVSTLSQEDQQKAKVTKADRQYKTEFTKFAKLQTAKLPNVNKVIQLVRKNGKRCM